MTATAASTSSSAGRAERLLRRLELTVLRRLDGVMQGEYRSLTPGGGLDFADLRAYEPDDDVRHIDWNVTARLDAPFVRQFIEERELTAWLLVDRSASMAAVRPQVGVLDPAGSATEMATLMARLLTLRGNKVGALLWDNRVVHTHAPSSSRRQVLRLAHELLTSSEPTGGPTDLAALFEAAAQRVRRRSLIMVLSDFVTDSDWQRPLAALAHRHEVIAVRIGGSGDEMPVTEGVVVVEDAETGEQEVVDLSDPEFRERHRNLAAARNAQVATMANAANVDFHDVSTAEEPARELAAMLTQRRRRIAR